MLHEFLKAQQKFTAIRKEYFYEKVLFSDEWWLLIILTIVPWIIWWKAVDRSRLRPIVMCGLIISLIAVILDDIGLTMSLWAYPYQTFFITSRMNAVDIAVLPVSYMLIYQYCTKWKAYLKAVAVFALFASFVAEPLFNMAGMYIRLNWEFFYSAPIYLVIGVFAKWLIDKLDKIADQNP